MRRELDASLGYGTSGSQVAAHCSIPAPAGPAVRSSLKTA